jgi:hypothetical protein
VKEGARKDTGQKVAIKIIDKNDAVFDAESLEQDVSSILQMTFRSAAIQFSFW